MIPSIYYKYSPARDRRGVDEVQGPETQGGGTRSVETWTMIFFRGKPKGSNLKHKVVIRLVRPVLNWPRQSVRCRRIRGGGSRVPCHPGDLPGREVWDCRTFRFIAGKTRGRNVVQDLAPCAVSPGNGAWKPWPESRLGCLICTILAPHRTRIASFGRNHPATRVLPPPSVRRDCMAFKGE